MARGPTCRVEPEHSKTRFCIGMRDSLTGYLPPGRRQRHGLFEVERFKLASAGHIKGPSRRWIQLHAGKHRVGGLVLNYCPFCGSFIGGAFQKPPKSGRAKGAA